VTDTLPPCADPENDPQDWFISANGKQYSFDDLLTPGERRGIRRSVLPIRGETGEQHEARVDSALSAAERSRKIAALRRRQAAKSKCFRCPIRAKCGRGAVARGEMHGTWGGMFEEEVAQVVALDRARSGAHTT
jgi:hypothetical protein